MPHDKDMDSKEGVLADEQEMLTIIHAKQQNRRSFNFIGGHLSLWPTLEDALYELKHTDFWSFLTSGKSLGEWAWETHTFG